MTPSCKRRFRNCNEFGLCVNKGQNGYVLAEDVKTFQSIFLYVVKGNGKIGKMFKTDYLDLNEGKFYDIRDFNCYISSSNIWSYFSISGWKNFRYV